MSDCKDHSEVESPWMCECTRKRIAELEADAAFMRDVVQRDGVALDTEIRRKQAEVLRVAAHSLRCFMAHDVDCGLSATGHEHNCSCPASWTVEAAGWLEVEAAAIERGEVTVVQARE